VDISVFIKAFNSTDTKGRLLLLSRISPEKKLAFLAGLSPENSVALASLAPLWFKNEKCPTVAAAIIKTFYKFWPTNEIQLLASNLGNPDLNIRYLSLEALIFLAPEKITRNLPQLLMSKDPKLWALAIQGLEKIDPEEADRHVQNTLLKGDHRQKLAAVRCLAHFPYEKAKPILLKMLASVMEPDILHQAVCVFQANPDPDLPFRLWEIVEKSPPVKSEVMKKILQTCLGLIEKSGVLKEPFSAYFERLQTWIYQRLGVRLVQESLTKLQSNEPEIAAELFEKLKKSLDDPGVKEALEEALTWPISEPARDLVNRLLAEPEEAEAIEERPQGKTWDPTVTTEEKLRVLASLDKNDLETFGPVIEKLINDENALYPIRIAAMRAAMKLGMKQFKDIAERWLGHFDVGITLVALDYLVEQKSTNMLPVLMKFVKKSDERQRFKAFTLLQRLFPGKGLDLIKQYLNDKNPMSHSIAIQALVCFDFTLVRETLTRFFEKNPESELLPQGLCLYSMNPDFENLYCLFRIGKAVSLEKSFQVEEATKKLREILIQFNLINPQIIPELEKEFYHRWKKENMPDEDLPEYSAGRMFKLS